MTTREKTPPEATPQTTGVLTAAEDVTTLATVNYRVAVHTGNVPGAGTDGDVWVWFDGTLGRSGPPWIYLDNDEDNFERNQTDYFGPYKLNDLGPLLAGWVYFRPSGLGPDWYLDSVTINGKTFTYHDWITDEGIYRLRPI